MKRIWRDWFYYPKSDRRTFLAVCLLLAALGGGELYMRYRAEETDPQLSAEEIHTFQRMLDSLTRDTVRHSSGKAPPYYAVPERKPETFPFDPNTADSSMFLRMGLQPWQIRNIYKYRAKGGRYHTPEDFSRLYGMTGETYGRLRPYIRIGQPYRLLNDSSISRKGTADSTRIIKYEAGTRIDLNLADTGELRRIPGIGTVYAGLIVRYRNRLGGFVSTGQLREIEHLPDSLEQWFFIHKKEVRQINLNHLNIDQLRRHPYLTFRQSRTILEHRRKFGPIGSLEELALTGEFTPEELERLAPYVCF